MRMARWDTGSQSDSLESEPTCGLKRYGVTESTSERLGPRWGSVAQWSSAGLRLRTPRLRTPRLRRSVKWGLEDNTAWDGQCCNLHLSPSVGVSLLHHRRERYFYSQVLCFLRSSRLHNMGNMWGHLHNKKSKMSKIMCLI